MAMAVQTEATQYKFQSLTERQIHEYFDRGGIAGLREMQAAVREDLDALGELIHAIERGESYSVRPDHIRAWWGWG